MRQQEDKELEESLDYMRQQFQSLTEGIPIPGSLRADLLKKQLEQMEAEQEEAEQEQELPRQRRVLPFSSRALLGVAACLAVVSLSMLSYQMGKTSSGAMEKLAPDTSPASVTREAVPSAPTAAPEEVMAVNEDAPVADFDMDADAGMDMAAAPDVGMGAPTPEMGEMAPEAFSAPVPDTEKQGRAANEAPQAVAAAEEPMLRAATPGTDGIAEVWQAYLPKTLPRGLSMVYSAQGEDRLTISYLNDDYSRQIQMTLRTLTPQLAQNQVEIDQPETYDLRMYEPPYSNTVPQGLAETVNNPVFRWEDVDEDVVASRVFASNGVFGQEQGNFGVLFATGIVAELNVTGVTSEEVFAMLGQMYS